MTAQHVGPALGLFLACLVVHYGYDLAEPAVRAHAWNIGGALGRLMLLALVVLAYRGEAVAWASAWWAIEEVQVIGCGSAHAVLGWPVRLGDDLCSSAVGVPPLALLGLLVAAAGLARIYRLTRRTP